MANVMFFAHDGQFLCDTCGNDYGQVCANRSRPNVICCKNYSGTMHGTAYDIEQLPPVFKTGTDIIFGEEEEG